MWLWTVLIVALLSGCASIPNPIKGDVAAISPQQTLHEDVRGNRVRWGGEIVKATAGKEETCFELLARPLDRSARPLRDDNTEGRFIACSPQFFDPAVYAKGRELTVVGTVQEPVTGKIGEYDYRYPRVAIDTLYLWPLRPDFNVVPQPYFYPYYSPFYRPFGFYDPFWYPMRRQHFSSPYYFQNRARHSH